MPSRTQRQPALLPICMQASSFLCHLTIVRSMAKPIGNKVFFMLSSFGRSTAKPAAAWLGKNSYKNGIAKVMRQANAQKPPKDSNHKHSPGTQSHHLCCFCFWSSLLPQRLVAKHFLLHFIF